MTADPGAAIPAGEAALVAASLRGDEGAFADLVQLHQHRVFKLAGRFFRSREDVEDAAQETFLRAWRKLASYQGRAPFEHWLTRVCLNCCYAKLKAAPRPMEVMEVHAEAAGASAHPLVSLEVEQALRTLDPRDRFILLLLDGEGWDVAEIAERAGWTRTNVKVRAFRARRRVRKLLERS
ncbi:MAG: sigma-70 family RNA polymerase sigma factor [Acidobacteria bacterium]|nr:sigma-70 family RNA polymerase sigma factor [Acidobacteriota bacterium]